MRGTSAETRIVARSTARICTTRLAEAVLATFAVVRVVIHVGTWCAEAHIAATSMPAAKQSREKILVSFHKVYRATKKVVTLPRSYILLVTSKY